MTDERNRVESYFIENREKLLAFVVGKVGDRDFAEDILQDGLLRALRSTSDLTDDDRFVSWFYRILRNAIIDTHRRRAAGERRFEKFPQLAIEGELTPEDENRLCECFVDLLPTLTPGYAEVIEAMELGDATTEEMVERLGISPNNLKVRRHRARNQLRTRLEETCRTCAVHGCLDCTCSR